MADYTAVGAHKINAWLWSLLKGFEYKTGEKAFGAYFDSGNSAGIKIVPMIPTQQEPELVNIAGGAPFIVYNYVISSYASEWWVCREQLAYVIYDDDEERLRAIQNYMVDLLKRFDWTARSINSYLGSSNYDFKYVQVTNAVSPDEFDTEGGRQGAMVTINYEYTVDLNGTEGNGLRA
jgi:hypothetical protein